MHLFIPLDEETIKENLTCFDLPELIYEDLKHEVWFYDLDGSIWGKLPIIVTKLAPWTNYAIQEENGIRCFDSSENYCAWAIEQN